MKCPNCDINLIQRPIDPPDMLHCPACPFIFAKNTKKAEFLYAALSVDKDGKEGIIATKQFGMMMSMVATRKELVEQMMTPEFFKSIKKLIHDVKIAKFKRVKL